MHKSLEWDRRFMAMADLVAGWSKDPSTRVGCVLVDRDRHVVATGYNGFPRGVADTEERLNTRGTKYLMVLHAEANAILQAVADTRGATAYVTHRPCSNCSAMLIQAGVKRIVTRRPAAGFAERFAESFYVADLMLGEAGVVVDYLGDGAHVPGPKSCCRSGRGAGGRFEQPSPRPGEVWLTYREASKRLGIKISSVQSAARREKWRRHMGTDGRWRVEIPASRLVDIGSGIRVGERVRQILGGFDADDLKAAFCGDDA